MKKIDIMNQRKDETWVIVNGKTQRVEQKKEKVKVTGPIVENAIEEIEEVVVIKEKQGGKEKSKKQKKA